MAKKFKKVRKVKKSHFKAKKHTKKRKVKVDMKKRKNLLRVLKVEKKDRLTA